MRRSSSERLVSLAPGVIRKPTFSTPSLIMHHTHRTLPIRRFRPSASQGALLTALALSLPVSAALLGTESFESAPVGSPPSYLASFFLDGSDYFQRVQVSGAGGDSTPQGFGGVAGVPVSGQDGDWVLVSEDVDDPANPIGPAGPAIIRLSDIDVSGFRNLRVTVRLTTHTAWNSAWETDDNIRIEYAFDGDSGGTGGAAGDLSSAGYSVAGQFNGNGMSNSSAGSGISFGPARDDNGDGVWNPAEITQIPADGTMTDFTFNIDGTGSDLSVQIVIDQSGGSEELAIDFIRVDGTVAATAPPVLADIEAGGTSWTEGGPATQVSNTITVTDPDSNIQSATVAIQSGYNPGEDSLSASSSPPGGIMSSFDSATGVLTLSGGASPANYQAALRQVTYANTSTNPNLFATRTLRFQLNDGSTNSNTLDRNLMVVGFVASATIPHLEEFDSDGNGERYTSNSFTAGSPTPRDYFERTDANPHPGHPMPYTFTAPQGGGYFASEDVDSAANPLGVAQPAIVRLPDLAASGVGALKVSVFLADNNNGTNLDGGEMIEVQAAFDGNTGGTDLSAGTYTTYGRFVGDPVSMSMREDSNLDGSSSDPADLGSAVLTHVMTEYTFHILGAGDVLSVQIAISNSSGSEELAIDHIEVTGLPIGPPPVLADIETAPMIFTEGGSPLRITNSITVTDADDTELEGATIQVVGNFQPDEDILAIDGPLPGVITEVAFNPVDGSLGLTGTASLADYQAALRQVTFQNINPTNPNVCERTITFQVNDMESSSNLEQRTVQVVGVVPPADAPYLEDFDTDGDGTRYTSNSFTDGQAVPQDFFERTDANPHPGHGLLTFTTPQGGGYWTSEDVDTPENKLGDHGIVRLRDIDVTSFTDRELRVFLAAQGSGFDTTEMVEIQYAYDGNSGGTDLTTGSYTTLARFINNGGTLRQDSDLDGISTDAEDTASPVLTAAMADYVFPIPDTGNIISIQVKVTGTSGTENISFDHVFVNGTPPVATVANADDSGAGSLRQTVADSLPNTTILFDSAVDGATITLGSGQLVIDKQLTIDATGLDRGITISGAGLSRVFEITAGNSVTLNKLTIANGASGNGGGIYNTGDLTIQNCAVVRNVGFGGGAIASIGAGASLEVVSSTITDNTALFAGAILSRDGAFHLVHSTISGNVGTGGTGALVLERGTATVENSIVAGNRGPGTHDFGGISTVVTALGANVIGTNDGSYAATFPADGILTGTNAAPVSAKLAPFSRYGGCTGTMHPLAGSPAFNNALVTGNSPAFDQRGLPRNVGSGPDIGALEGGPTVVVTNTDDSGAGSLRKLISDASGNPGTRIYFSTKVFPTPGPITLAPKGDSLDIADLDLFIDASEIAGGVDVSGGFAVRIFNVDDGSTVGIANLNLLDGNTAGSTGNEAGAILIQGASSVTLMDGKVTGNVSQQRGGAVEILSNSTFHARRCSFTLNASGGNNGGGAIYNSGAGSTVHLVDCAFTDNTSPTAAGAIHAINGAATIAQGCYFARNTAVDAGAVRITNDGPLTLENCTFEGNEATGDGGAILSTGSLVNTVIRHCTILNNSAGNDGGGIHKAGTGSLTLENTIVSGNKAAVGPDMQGGPTVTAGVNLIGDPSGAGSVGLGILGVDYLVGPPLVAPPAHYGGPTLSMPPLPDSAAVDAGGFLANAPATDQRGFSRPQGGAPDIGAVERSGLFTDAGPYLVDDIRLPLTGIVSRDDTAGDVLFFRYTVDPISDFTVENYFAAFQLYEAGAERLGVGNAWGPHAYSVFNTTAGDLDLNSANPEPGVSYELIRSGVPRTLVFRVDYVPGGDDVVSVWLAPALNLPAYAQAPALLTTFTANASFDEVLLREGFGAGGWSFRDMEISELSPFSTTVSFAALHPGLDPDGDENDDGLTNFYHYASGDDPFAPVFQTSLDGGLYTHAARTDGNDFLLDYESSQDLQSFDPMVPGVHYTIDATGPAAPNVNLITIEVLFDPLTDPRIFWRHRFAQAIP